MLYQRYMCVTLQRPLPSLYVFACKNGRVVAELWASCAEYRASCGRVVRVLGELFGKIVEFGQLAQKRLGRHLCLGGVTRGGQCIFSGFLNSTRSAVSDPTSHYPRPPGKRPGGPKIPKIVTGSDQKIKIPKKKGVLGQGLYLAYSYFLAHKRDMAMATAHDSYFRK